MTDQAPRRPAFIPAVIYKDNRAALAWLERAFGFEPTMVVTDSQDAIVHAEMSHGAGVIMVGPEWDEWTKSPVSLGGANTQAISVRIDADIDWHCDRARAAGAVIEQEPEDQFYGDRTYRAIDLEGHHWTFLKPVRPVSDADMEKATGLKVSTRP